MKEFMMIFRNPGGPESAPSPQELQETMIQWQEWIGRIASQGKFVSTSRLGFETKIVSNGGIVTDGPYADLKEIVGGNMVVLANTLDEAAEIAKDCPILKYGGKVEVRTTMGVNM